MKMKDYRIKCRISQQCVAQKIGVGRTTYAMWELKKATPPINKIGKLAKALNVSEAEIIACFK